MITSLKISDKEKVLKVPREQTRIMEKSKGKNDSRLLVKDDTNHK